MSSIVQSRFVRAVLIIAVLGVAGWLTPYAPFKFMVGLVSIVLLAIFAKPYIKKVTGLVVLSVLIFLLPMTLNLYSHVVSDVLTELNIWPNVFVHSEVRPSESHQVESTLSISTEGNIEISLVEGNIVEFPAELELKQFEDRLEFSGGKDFETYVFKIGTQNLKVLQLRADSISLKGEGSLEELQIEAASVNMRGDFNVKHVSINGAGVNLNGAFSGEYLQLDGTGVNLNGEFSFARMHIDGTGISLKVQLNDCESVLIEGTGISGTMSVTGTKTCNIILDGVGGTVTVRNSIGKKLRVQSSNIKVVSE